MRLKQKSQSVDIASQGFSPKLVPASPQNKAAPPVAKTTTGLVVQENNTTNSQLRNPRCGELKRGYTIASFSPSVPSASVRASGVTFAVQRFNQEEEWLPDKIWPASELAFHTGHCSGHSLNATTLGNYRPEEKQQDCKRVV
ncbi:Oxidation resistance protein 1 [Oryzias melastigma]|uniref:Oxidation resistance protein 1 n=1 Tax=Oryzias melastigma TaxID=30732 RepID=A0A834C8A3_ORYME|nr:Oxidation resistance protein 1 [Oryzias melastigma]